MRELGPRVLILDNYDSYTHNLYQRIGEVSGSEAKVVRNDQSSLAEILALRPTHIVISPGPGSPEKSEYFGVCLEVILKMGNRVPILGICLGHQGIAHAFGARLVRAPKPMHGKTSLIRHDGKAVFQGLEDPFVAMRYHSLVVSPEAFPKCLRVTARSDDGVIMGLCHREFPLQGVQFHPESIGTPTGHTLLRNFLSSGTSSSGPAGYPTAPTFQ
jgi:anthranilate synthase component 2